MTKKDYRKWDKKLVRYWKMRKVVLGKFKKEECKIEKLMKKETGMNLEFFYTEDGECRGIGHEELERRDKKRPDYFPLIHDLDLRKSS